MPVCTEPGCPVLVDKGRCPDHGRVERHRRKVDTLDGLLRTARWRRLREQVIQEQPFCDEPGCTDLTDEVHHIVKRTDDPSLVFVRSNLAGKCKACHARLTREGK